MPNPIPTVGRTVHFRLPAGPHRGQLRPAVIVRVWSAGDPRSALQLQVFTDGGNDNLTDFALAPQHHGAWKNVIWVTSVGHGDAEGQWQWPTIG